MAKEKEFTESGRKERRVINSGGTSSAVYGLGFIGALVYFLQHATGFWVWPAMLAYKSLEFFKL